MNELHQPSTSATAPTPVRGKNRFDAIWVRKSLGVLRFLESVHALPPPNRALVTFAVMWAPFGGSPREDLLVTFGVSRSRFLALLSAALTPDGREERRVQDLKSALRDDLALEWR
ncbi:hypothetical protein [Rhodococcus gannanensis]|uniref:DUF3263 domain-containing protein n=1 Tax=Rhodococcus gannanensis TaxID=1960308 RepID=A0ABW4P234_9NOCA